MKTIINGTHLTKEGFIFTLSFDQLIDIELIYIQYYFDLYSGIL